MSRLPHGIQRKAYVNLACPGVVDTSNLKGKRVFFIMFT